LAYSNPGQGGHNTTSGGRGGAGNLKGKKQKKTVLYSTRPPGRGKKSLPTATKNHNKLGEPKKLCQKMGGNKKAKKKCFFKQEYARKWGYGDVVGGWVFWSNIALINKRKKKKNTNKRNQGARWKCPDNPGKKTEENPQGPTSQPGSLGRPSQFVKEKRGKNSPRKSRNHSLIFGGVPRMERPMPGKGGTGKKRKLEGKRSPWPRQAPIINWGEMKKDLNLKQSCNVMGTP